LNDAGELRVISLRKKKIQMSEARAVPPEPNPHTPTYQSSYFNYELILQVGHMKNGKFYKFSQKIFL
jgi:hypothetical protein